MQICAPSYHTGPVPGSLTRVSASRFEWPAAGRHCGTRPLSKPCRHHHPAPAQHTREQADFSQEQESKQPSEQMLAATTDADTIGPPSCSSLQALAATTRCPYQAAVLPT